MMLNLILFILIFSSQAFADATSHMAGYTGVDAIGPFQTVEVGGNVGIGTLIPDSLLTLYSGNNIATLTLDSVGAVNGIDSYTKLLLHLDNNVTDSETTPKTVTNNSVTFSSSIYKFGAYSGSFNGTSSYLTLADSNDWYFGTGDFTIEGWFYFNSLASSPGLFTQYASSGNRMFSQVASDGTVYYVDQFGGAFKAHYNTAAGAITTGVWTHIAIVRNTSSLLIFINGISQALTVTTPISTNDLGDIATNFSIGGDPNFSSTQYLNGYVDEFRVSKGVARWTSDFIPPNAAYSAAQVPIAQIILKDRDEPKARFWIDGGDSDKIKIDDSSATRLTISGGNVGIGSTSPSVLLDIAGPVRMQTGLITNGAVPTIGTGAGDCGTSPSVVGNDISGTVTVGSGANGGKCTVTFSAVKSSAPNCICQNSTTANLARAANQSTSGLECTGTLTAADKLTFWCPQ